MSFRSGEGYVQGQPGGLLASQADREATQDVLKKAFEDERLTQDEFEARVGRALAARTQAELAELTRDLPRTSPPPARRVRRKPWPVTAGLAAVVLAAIIFFVAEAPRSSPATRASAGPTAAQRTGPPSSGPAGCPVGTSPTAVAIANSMTKDPVYLDPGSALLTAAQVRRLEAEIARDDRGRIRIAAVTPATLSRGGGARALANAIANCPATSAGSTLVTSSSTTYLVTSYSAVSAASQAVQSALNSHASLAAGLIDSVRRLAIVDKDSS